MATQTAVEYTNGRVSTTSYISDDGTQVVNTATYTVGTYDYSRAPNKPATISDPTWWDKAHQGQESSLTPTSFADSYFKLRSFYETTPSRPAIRGASTLARSQFNKISLY